MARAAAAADDVLLNITRNSTVTLQRPTIRDCV